MLVPERDQPAREVEQPLAGLVDLPVEPGDLVVLAPGVVAAALRAAHLVAAEQHRRALGEDQRGEEVAALALAGGHDGGVVGRPLDAHVPGAVVVRPVLVVLEVGLVVLLVVGDEVVEREAVVGGDEVDRRERVAAVALVEVAGAGEARRELVHARLPAPEVAHRVAIDAIPLRPQDREVADLVTARADVPRLGDQLHLGQDRVLVDDVEEAGEAVDVVELARERAGEVEAEAVDVALVDPVAQRVHDQPQHARMDGVERVPGAREVHVEVRVVGHEPVVAPVVDALEGQHRAQVVALGGVVVDDVEDHLDARPVQGLDHALELAHLLAADAGRRVARVRRQVADRGVAPVVGEPAVGQEGLVGDVVDRQQLDGGHAERLEVLDRGLGGQAGVGAAQVLAHAGVAHGEPLDVRLVDHRLVHRGVRRPVVLPVEAVVDDHRLGDRGRRVLVVALEVGVVAGVGIRDVGQDVAAVPAHLALDRLGVRVDQQLVRVEAVAGARVVRAVDAVAVALAGADAGQVDVPVERGALGELDALLGVVVVEQAQLDPLRVLGEQGEVGSVPVPASRPGGTACPARRLSPQSRYPQEGARQCGEHHITGFQSDVAGGDDRLGRLLQRDVGRAAREAGDQHERPAPHPQPAGVLVEVDRRRRRPAAARAAPAAAPRRGRAGRPARPCA